MAKPKRKRKVRKQDLPLWLVTPQSLEKPNVQPFAADRGGAVPFKIARTDDGCSMLSTQRWLSWPAVGQA